MTKCSINCPYCNEEIAVDFSKIKTSDGKKKKPTKITKIITMNDLASILKIKNREDLVISSLSYLNFIKKYDVVPYGDLYRVMKNTGDYHSKFKGSTKESIANLIKSKKIIEISNNKYQLDNKVVKRIDKLIKKYL